MMLIKTEIKDGPKTYENLIENLYCLLYTSDAADDTCVV